MLVVFIIDKDDLIKNIKQGGLIDIEPSLAGVSGIEQITNSFFGVGLSNGVPELSKGVPFDILSMIFLSEMFTSGNKNILIADEHAVSNGFNQHAVSVLARTYITAFEKILINLGFNNWNIVKASDINKDSTYQLILNSINDSNEYIKRQLADMAWFNQERDVNLKVGWSMNGTKNSDEKAFDNLFEQKFGNVLSFIYSKAGINFDPDALRSSPYFCKNPDARILMDLNENVEKKLIDAKNSFGVTNSGMQAIKTCENHLNQIVRLYNKIIDDRTSGPLYERVQYIIDRCMR